MSKLQKKSILVLLLSLIFIPKASFSTETELFGKTGERYGVKPGAFRFETITGMYWNGAGQFLFDTRDRLTDTWTLGLSFGYAITEFLEVGAYFAYTPTKSTVDRQDVYQLSPTITLQYPRLSDQFVPYVDVGFGIIGFNSPITKIDWDSQVNYGVGLKIFLFKNLYLAPEFRALTSFRPTNTAFMALLKLGVYAGAIGEVPFDKDRDGIPDAHDRCPEDPETRNGYQDEDGCPDTVPGVPAEKIEKAVPRDDHAFDSDQDGIPDSQDKCPNKAEDLNDYKDRDGCPDAAELALDQDRDFILTPQDQCPNEAEDFNNYFDEDGCPDAEKLAKDKDRDGIVDDHDECPEEPETINGFKDADGCPDHELAGMEGPISELTFQVGKAVIDPASFRSLDRLVDALNRYPDSLIKLEGHTDNTGSKAINEKLSRARAKSVKDYFVQAGVDSSRVTFEGYGPNQPISDNKTWLGRQQNRRVELKIVNREALFPKAN